ncbi:MAG TPA: hypothetical protein P5121_34450, partial [Caldilineaceae bacterium]|nr:hypothetical protein [Caldilineaceae bacterium]
MKHQRPTSLPILSLCLLGLAGLLILFATPGGPLPVHAQDDPGPTVVTHHETIPNPVFGSALRVADGCKAVVTPCAWAAASTWREGRVPDAADKVII